MKGQVIRYVAKVDGQTYTVDIEEGRESLRVLQDGEPTDVDLRQVTEPMLFSFLKDGASYEILAEEAERGYAIVIAGRRFQVEVADERSLRLASVQKREVERRGDMVIKTPMPGMVVDVFVKPGDTVRAGQSLLTLTAMKMENEIRAFADGTVKTLNVQKGDKVEQGQVLAVIG